MFCTVWQDEREYYGIDWDGPVPYDNSSDDIDAVTVPETECPLNALDMDELDDEVSPLSDTTNYGIDLFVSTKLNIIL